VERPRSWLHNGLFEDLGGVLNFYNAGLPHAQRKAGQENDPLLQSLHLSQPERPVPPR
jgi:cytochrome c peroxidase